MRKNTPKIRFQFGSPARAVAVLLAAALAVFSCACRPSPADVPEEAVTRAADLVVETPLGAPRVDPATYRLAVVGEVARPLSLTLADLAAFPQVRRSVALHYIEGHATQRAEWTGIRLVDVFARAGVASRADRVVFHGADGFETSIPAADATADGMILATGVAGQALPRAQGFPVRLVAEGKYDYKWAKWVTEIRLIRGDHKGYWEGFGYDVDGNVRQTTIGPVDKADSGRYFDDRMRRN